jgi:glyoxylase-like metal-dependent hydrolase (beta-lactamase superfamily II)
VTTAHRAKPVTYTPAHNFIPESGQAADIGGGLFWLRMPLPFELNHINLWLMESRSGWAIVDTGFNFQETQAHWDGLFDKRFRSKAVDTIFVTHFHPDHFGLAAMLSKRAGVTVQMTQAEYDIARSLSDGAAMPKLEQQYRSYYAEAGLDDALKSEMIARRFGYRKMVPEIPDSIKAVKPGDTLRLGGGEWKILGGYGHCPEHACLYSAERKIFISGDIVLPTISPNISLYPGSTGDPVGAYLDTLQSIEKQIPDDVIVLPSHGVPFTGLHRRLGELREHHLRRLDRLREVLSDGAGKTAFEAMQGLFAHRELKGGDIFFALGETLAHLMHEVLRGKVRRQILDGKAVFSLSCIPSNA